MVKKAKKAKKVRKGACAKWSKGRTRCLKRKVGKARSKKAGTRGRKSACKCTC